MLYENKYCLSRENNILFAKRNLVDSIWKAANLNGIAITFPDTYLICNGMSVAGHTVDEIYEVNNMKKAWKYLLDNVDADTDLSFILKLHSVLGNMIVTNAGCIRLYDDIGIGGTNWIPPVPDKKEMEVSIHSIMHSKSTSTEKALDIFLYLARAQAFYDGNKRISLLAANKILISSGCGILNVPIELQASFLTMLIKFYESGDFSEIKPFLYNNCIQGFKE